MKSWFKLIATASIFIGMYLYAGLANAIPIFARQTQQVCAACHVGGQYPELTPYGRYFKLTGFTQGDSRLKAESAVLPFAMSIQAGVNKMQNNLDSTGAEIDARNGKLAPDQLSLYAGGRFSDNVGLFAQLTYAYDQGNSTHGTLVTDNVDLRYADHIVDAKRDLIWGLSLNNDPTVTDVFNTVPAWSYPFQYSASGSGGQPPAMTQLENFGGGTAMGLNGYMYLNKSYYAEVGAYKAASRLGKVLTYTNDPTVPDSNATLPLVGTNPYFRFAYTTEWGPSNLMLGAFGMRSTIAGSADDGTSTVYTDKGVDAQYQYISSPHVVSTQFRYISENISDTTGAYSGSPNLKSYYAKAMYVYRAKYGVGLAYRRESGTEDTFYNTVVPIGSSNNSPNTSMWIPSVFWQPLQNVRFTLYKTMFKEYLGSSNNYDGNGRNASDNNTTYLYMWMDF